MSDLILYHYEQSPFALKVRKMLAIKGLAWNSVDTPVILPKPDLVAITGGYRGVPVLQIGADVFIDSHLIGQELERRHPEPTLFPNGNTGMPQALTFWSNALFRAVMEMLLPMTWEHWPEPFREDRKAMFPGLDWDRVARTQEPFGPRGAQPMGEVRVHLALIDEQLRDGRAFLQGDAPGMTDIQAAFAPAFVRGLLPDVSMLYAGLERVAAWEQRVADRGEGTRTEIDARAARDAAAAAEPAPGPGVDPADPVKVAPGTAVTVAATDADRGAVTGTLHGLDRDRIVVLREADGIGPVAVHFPRHGFRLAPA